MKDNVLIIILAIIVVVLSSLLLGNVVAISLGPIISGIAEVKTVQREIRNDVKEELININKRLEAIEARQNSGAMPTAVANQAVANKSGCGAANAAAGGGDLKAQDIPLGDSPILGRKNAPVTIVAFFDLQCPFCNRFYPAAKEAQKAYPDKVKLVIKHYPLQFHPNAAPAAKLALAANLQRKYFEMLELLLQNGAVITDDKIKEYAQKLNLNYSRLMADYKNKDAQWQKQVDADKALGDQVGVRGTPTFFINGRLSSARDVEAYKAEIEKLLSDKK